MAAWVPLTLPNLRLRPVDITAQTRHRSDYIRSASKSVLLRTDMIEAVIWDFGGVFTTSPFDAFERYEREKGIPIGLIRKINSTNHEDNAWAMFERSDIDFAGFDAAYAEEALT